MEKWINSHIFILTLAGGFITVTAYVFTTFATVDYVNTRHTEISKTLEKMDSKLDRIQDKLSERRR